MTIEPLHIKGLFLVKPRIFSDDRGHFFESFNQALFDRETGETITFVQDNESLSAKNVLRGLHFQVPPMAQGKLVRVVRGAVLDVAVDLRKDSETYGQHIAVELTESNRQQLWIPPGFAHGFLALEEDTIFAYKCSGYYSTQHEQAIRWDDPTLNINWNCTTPLLSEKDAHSLDFSTFNSPF